ncbi:MAG: chorismate synthase [Ruminococcaceae bacterium]|nr:chorismate synthase [Oscillospiraceae bacterium]
MSSTYGESLKLSIFGQSHSAGIGMVLDGIPAGLPVDMVELQQFLNRRAPGQNDYSTARRETDTPEFLSGISEGFTCGAPISAVIRNSNTRSGDYDDLRDCPRPGHADYTAHIKYGGFHDIAGGGHFSGRLTAPLCIAGGMCKQWLTEMGIEIGAHITRIGSVVTEGFSEQNPQLGRIGTIFPTLTAEAAEAMQEEISRAKADGDSVGGVIECAVIGLPAGLGEPMFGGIESKLAQILYGIPAVKGLEFGAGFASAALRGSENNDSFAVQDGKIVTVTNRCGAILGGISNGMPLLFRIAIKPTPSIAREQQSISLSAMEEKALVIQGRHDPCIVPRAVPVVEAAAAVAIYDLILSNTQTQRRKL